MKEVTEEIKALQERLEEGDVIIIWKDDFQIKLKGNAATDHKADKKLIDRLANQKFFNGKYNTGGY